MFTNLFPAYSETFLVRKFLGFREKGIEVYVVGRRSKYFKNFPSLSEHQRYIFFLPELKKTPAFFPKAVSIFLITILKNLKLSFKYFKTVLSIFGIKGVKKFFTDYPVLIVDPDIIHFEFFPIFKEHWYLKKVLPKTKFIVSVRGSDGIYMGLENNEEYKKVISFADAFHFVGGYLIRWMERKRDIKFTNRILRVISPAVPDELLVETLNYSSRDGKRDAVHLLSVGRLHWAKGYEYILKALEILKYRYGIKFKFRIIGTGELEEMLVYLIERFGLHEEVELMGYLPFEEVRKVYKWADIYLNGMLWGSLYEGTSNAMLEAMAIGLPVVAGEVKEHFEEISKEGWGVPVLDRRDPEEWARAIYQLAISPEKRRLIGEKAKEVVKKRFIISKQIEEFLRLYEEVCNIYR